MPPAENILVNGAGGGRTALMLSAGVLLIYPGIRTDLLGVALAALVYLSRRFSLGMQRRAEGAGPTS